MERFYDCVIHPKEDDSPYSGKCCPTGKNDCNHCEHCKYIGTIGGEYYVDCSYDDNEQDNV